MCGWKASAAPVILTNGPAMLVLTSPSLQRNAALIRSALALKRPGSYLGRMGQHHHHHLEQTGESLAGAAKLTLEQQGEQRSEEHTSELQSLMRISYAVFCLKKKNTILIISNTKQCYINS